MRNVYVVAHTQSIHHVEKRVGGWYDTSLTDLGKQQANKVGAFFAETLRSYDVLIFSSDLRRAAETANIIAANFNQEVTLEPGLREISYGDAEGKPQTWLDDRIVPQPTDGKRLDHRVCDGAESRRELASRIKRSLENILEHQSKETIIVSHGFALTFIIMAWMRIPIENMDYCNFASSPGGITLLHEDDFFGNRGVKYVNKTDHLHP